MRVKRLLIAPELLLFMTSGKFEVIANGAPEGARIGQATIDPITGCVCLFVVSEAFDDLPNAAIPPMMNPPLLRRLEEA